MSDSTDLTIIIIVLVILLAYTYYVQYTIIASYNINSVKCSPINMFLKSINNSEEGKNNFAECVYLLNETVPVTSKTNTNNSK